MTQKMYTVKANRDSEARRLSALGIKVKRSSIRGQLLHPMYVEETKASLQGLDRCFGNSAYRAYFAILYILEELNE